MDYIDRYWLTFLSLIIVLFFSILSSCSVAKQSKFISQNVSLGTYKEDVKNKFGNPYKIGLYKDNDQVVREDWFYKENLFVEKWYEITTILHFQNNKLISVEPGKETPLYNHKVLIKEANQ